MKAALKLRRPSPRPISEPVIALVDVVFFLLVFFMLVARMDASAPFEVIPPSTHAGESLPSGGATVAIGKDGDIAINGTISDKADWARVLTEAMQRDRASFVRLNADGGASLAHVLPIVTTLEDGAFGNVVLVVTPPVK